MSEIIDRRIYDVQGVAAGQTAVVTMPIGLSYHRLVIPYSGVTLSQMEELRLIANGDTIQRFRGADHLDVFNQYDGMSAASGELVLDFERYGVLARDARELTRIGTNAMPMGTGKGQDPRKISQLSLEIDLASGASGPAIPYVKAYQSAPSVSGTVKRITRRTYSPGGTGQFEISDLAPRSGRINRLLIHQTGTFGIDEVKIERDNAVAYNRTKAENELEQANGIRTAQSNWWVVDRTERGWGADPFDVRGVQDFRMIFDLSQTGQIEIYMEELDFVRKF